MAVPGHPVDGRAGGCNRLIRDGATLIRNVEDVLEVLERLRADKTPAPQGNTRPPVAPPTATPGNVQSAILQLLGPTPIHEDLVIRDMGLSAAIISPALVALELDGAVQRHPGGLVSRA
jgi:DNA processing protein